MISKNKAITLIVALLLILLAVFLGSKIQSDKFVNDEKETIRVARGADSIATQLLFDFAKDKDYFSKYNLNVEETVTTRGSSNALSAEQVDLSVGQVSGKITQYLNNEDIVWIDSVYKNQPDTYLVIKEQDTSKKIKFGVAKLGGNSQIIATNVLTKMGWKEEDLEYALAGEAATRFAYFETGKIDAAFMYPGEGLEKAKELGYKIVKPNDLFKDIYTPIGIFSTKTKINEKSKTIKEFTKAFKDFRKYVLSNKNESIEFMKNKYQITQSEANDVFESIDEMSKTAEPKTNDIEVLTKYVIEVTKPSNQDRNLKEFIDLSFYSKN